MLILHAQIDKPEEHVRRKILKGLKSHIILALKEKHVFLPEIDLEHCIQPIIIFAQFTFKDNELCTTLQRVVSQRTSSTPHTSTEMKCRLLMQV